MKPLHDKKHIPAKRFLSLLCILALCLGLLPVTALAAGDAPDTLWVGQTQITGSGYWTTDDSGKLTTSDENSYNVYYDGNGTLTLNNATIQGRGNISEGDPIDNGIYAAFTSGQSVSLTIKLIGSNTVRGYSGICVDASGGDSTLVIQSDGNDPKGSLEAIGSGWNGIGLLSDSGNVFLKINKASVEASTEMAGYYGVSVKSDAGSPTISLTVSGGSLTAQGDSKLSGIRYFFQESATTPSISLTVKNNALVKAMPGIDTAQSTASKPTPQGNGIVFDGNSGTVYGTVELQNDLTIDQDETLTIPEGASLTVPEGTTLTNNGTINVESGGSITGEPTGGSGTVVKAPTITTQPENQTVTVGQTATFTVTATGEKLSYKWQQSTDNGQSWTNIGDATDATYTEEATTTSMNGYQYRCVVSNSAGSVTSEVATLTVTEPTTYTITANVAPAGAGTVTVNGSGTSATVTANSDVTLTATANDGYRFTGWMENDRQVSTDATYTFKATGDRTLTAKFEKKVTGVTLNTETLELFTGNTATLSATVAPDNATNKNVTWSSDKPEVATVENGTVTAVGAGTTTITVTTEDGSYTATCTVTVTDKTYTISADTTALDFGNAYTGYAQPAAKTVTLTNTGNQPVTLTQPTADNYVIGMLSATTLEPNATATFTVQPKAGLAPGNYDENILITGSSSASASVATSFTVRERPYIPPTPPTVSEETTDAIADAQPGETVSVALKDGDTTLDAEVFETLAGQDITLEIALEGGVTWSVNGTDIPADANLSDLDLGVEMNSDGIPVDVVNSITGERDSVQMTLAHDGAFGFTMTLTAPLGVENAGYWANPYHYDEEAEALNFEAAAKIDEDGSVTIPFSHASQYAIVIDTHSHATVDVSDLFIDIAPDAWYKDAIQYAYDNGLMTGVSATEFAPEQTTTRAMIVSILARLEGVTTAQAAGFADVDDEWYATAVNWAANVGVVNGYEDNTFRPNTAITREQLAAILMNYAAYKGEDVSNRASLATYTDQPSTWAEEAMQWAVAEGLISGVTNTELQPQGNATRAQVAAIFQRYLEA